MRLRVPKMRRIVIDSASLADKVAIRRWLLDRMNLREVYVLDACSGAGDIWSAMEDHVLIRRWTRCDVMPRTKGTLALDAVESIRRLPIQLYDVIDIDPYGDPFAAYMALLKRITKPTAVFVTHGYVRGGVTRETLDLIGLPRAWDRRLPDLVHKLPMMSSRFIAEMVLTQTWNYVDILHSAAIHHTSHGPSGVSYYALGLAPKPPA